MRKRLLNLAARVVAFGGLAMTRVLPLGFLRRLGDALGSVAYFCLGSRRRMMLEHLTIAFGDDLSRRERRRLAIASLRNLGRTCFEFLKLAALSPERVKDLMPIVGVDRIAECMQRGQGAIIVTTHSGNWEYLAARLAAEGVPLCVLAREHDDAPTAGLINGIRERAGVRVVSKWDLRAALRWLKQGNVLGILPDQNVAEGGVLADFLGRPATTFTTPANFALRTGAAVIPAYGLRLPDG
ncbi:MAG: lysophospholipid acyltransferase family protein, partial [Armatimonadota bacterium]